MLRPELLLLALGVVVLGVSASPAAYSRHKATTAKQEPRPLQDFLYTPRAARPGMKGLLPNALAGAALTNHVMVFFECPPGDAVCHNGGRGPAITYRERALPICTCICPKEFDAPQCTTSMET